ncbi:MAG: hypothetical protein JWP04_607 [Belnapia sp.]|nr:hypothetical protein [Belnapia sp.]
MPYVQVSGAIPNSIREGSRLGAWVGGLAVSGDTGHVVAIETTGAAALNFSVHWNPGLAFATIDAAAAADYESFAAGTDPLLVFGLSIVFDDGSRQAFASSYAVTLLDADDTAPTGLSFATGGSVTAGAIGSIIGTLAVTDPDSAGPFTYSFTNEEDWRFEVVGNTLKLRDGISLGLDEMPSHPLIVSVSDGTQGAAFVLDLTVTDPGDQESAVVVLAAGAPRAGFDLTSPWQVVTLRDSRDVTALNGYGEGIHQALLAEGGEVWLPAVETLRLADGHVDFTPSGDAARAAALHAAVAGAPASGADLARILAPGGASLGWVEAAAALLTPALAALPAADLVTSFYQSALDRDPDAAELALQTGRLASGTSRAQILADIAGSPEALAAQATADGIWVADNLGGAAAWHLDAGGQAFGQLVEAGDPIGFAWLL